ILALVAALGGPAELGAVLDIATAKDAPAGRQAVLLDALAGAARQRQVRPAGDLARLGKVLSSDSEEVQAAALRLVGLWKLEALRPQVTEAARAESTPESVRLAALEGLALLGGPASRETLEQLTDDKRPLEVRRVAVAALASLDAKAAAPRAVDVLAAHPAGADPSNLFAAFLRQKNGIAALTAALEGKKLPADVAKLGVRAVRATGRDAPALLDALAKAGNLTTGARKLTEEEMRQLVADVAKHGDPARGETVFRRKDQVCLKCHAIGGAGGQVGPDLSSIGASAPVDYLIDSLLDPNKAVKEGYHSVLVATKDGKVHTGIVVRQTAGELVLRDAEDREVPIPTRMIEAKENGRSLMPDGLTDPLTRAELIDLVRFLSELGKVGPYAVGKARVVRRWQALEPTPAAYRVLHDRGSVGAAAGDPALIWSPAYSTVAGTLPLDAVPIINRQERKVSFVRCQLDVSTAGKVKLLLNSAAGVTAWLDGAPIEAKAEMVLDLPAGLRTLTFAVEPGKRKEALRLELDDVPGSPARARVVGGK
ncbi:MAG TPA: HEAT repeat domain-containing protein, partial [Gemmataceae bacterium]|nr:HEAT repeat domain-containing protein [Gemmataceae bacterium]